MSGKAKTIVVTYRGREMDAHNLFKADAAKKAKKGYYPVTEKFIPGSWGCGAFLLALLACVILVGILAFIYMLLVKPAGILTVKYELRETVPADAGDTMACPRCAETIKAAAKVCRYCNHELETVS